MSLALLVKIRSRFMRLYALRVVHVGCKPVLPAFALIEVIAALAIMTVVSMYFISITVKLKNVTADNMTKDNMDIAFRTLANYVAQNGRLPYPAQNTDGREIPYNQWPEDESDWEQPKPELIRGILPYTTLGLDKRHAQDGYGYFFTYRVNPALCGRKSVISIPPGDIRERIDITQSNARIMSTSTSPVTAVAMDRGLKIGDIKYSCYTGVRSHTKSYHDHEGKVTVDDTIGANPKSLIRTWDIATRIPKAQLKCISNDKEVNIEGSFILTPDYPSNDPWRGKVRQSFLNYLVNISGIHLFGEMQKKIPKEVSRSVPEKEYEAPSPESRTVYNCIAVILVSHGPSHIGALSPKGQVVSTNTTISDEKISNGYNSSNPSVVYQNSQSKYLFDDTVRYMSRFQLAILGSFPMKPFVTFIIDPHTLFSAPPGIV